MTAGRSFATVVHTGSSNSKTGLVTVEGKPGDELAPGNLNCILKHAGLKPWNI